MTKKNATTTKTRPEVQQAAYYRCTVKETGEVFYAVKSDSTNAWYTLSYDERDHAWHCSCPATKPCKHERGLNELLCARHECHRVPEGEQQPTEVTAEPACTPQSVSEPTDIAETMRRDAAQLERAGHKIEASTLRIEADLKRRESLAAMNAPLISTGKAFRLMR